MHTMLLNVGENATDGPEVTAHYHGDYSGDVQLVMPLACATPDKENGTVRVELPVNALLEFVAAYVRDRRIEWLERADDEAVLFNEIGTYT